MRVRAYSSIQFAKVEMGSHHIVFTVLFLIVYVAAWKRTISSLPRQQTTLRLIPPLIDYIDDYKEESRSYRDKSSTFAGTCSDLYLHNIF